MKNKQEILNFFLIQEREIKLLKKNSDWLDKLLLELNDNDDFQTRMASESSAFQIQRIYTGLEEILKSTVGKFGQAPSGENSYSELLKISVIKDDKRPAILDETTFELMNELRAFRHFARHNYGSTIKPERIEEISKTTIKCLDLFEKNWEQFKESFLKSEPKNKNSLKVKP